MPQFQTISPIDGSVYYSAEEHSPQDIDAVLTAAASAKNEWSTLSISERGIFVTAFVDALIAIKDEIAEEITWQMGRPISQSGREIDEFEKRARYMIMQAPEGLLPIHPEPADGSERWIERVPLGVIAVLSPWNYPFLTSVNAIIPALMAGNTVILKHSFQTPLVAERYAKAAVAAGFPNGVFQILHLNHANTGTLIKDPRIDGVYFTGSVAGGHAIQHALSDKFIPCGLELGGKDPAYVRADADIKFAATSLIDGAFFNSGQSCCGIERIYVYKSVYNDFIDRFIKITRQYKLGNPLDPDTSLGPVVKTSAANFVRRQINAAIKQGAKSLVDESLFPASRKDSPYLSPHVLVDVNHNMEVMTIENFGPVVGIQVVANDKEALQLMNDSDYGLTASIWTKDDDIARSLGSQLETGTVFMNRSTYLDPALAWTGVKNSGRGVTLSTVGYEHVTRPKSFNFRLET